MKNTTGKRMLAAGALLLTLTATVTQTPEVHAASAKLNCKKVTLSTGNKYKLKLTGIRGKAKWKSSNKRVAKVSQNGLVTAKKTGKASITAKIRRTKYTCRVTVKKQQKKTVATANPISTQQPVQTVKPSPTARPVQTTKPSLVIKPSQIIKPSQTAKPSQTVKPVQTAKPSQTAAPVQTNKPTDSVLTEQSVYATLNSLRSTYPEGMTLTNSYYYYSPQFGNGYGCYGFAAKLSDTAFGTTKPYQTHSSFDQIKVGDHVRIGNSHSVIVLTKAESSITVVEGNYNSSVHWDRKITAASLASSGFKVYTRY